MVEEVINSDSLCHHQKSDLHISNNREKRLKREESALTQAEVRNLEEDGRRSREVELHITKSLDKMGLPKAESHMGRIMADGTIMHLFSDVFSL